MSEKFMPISFYDVLNFFRTLNININKLFERKVLILKRNEVFRYKRAA